ncbi:MAG: hypothetical protein HKP27_04765 [Myxococcales bacterium]|nr:hypothetical protein [Myxococcales bacterium]
MKNLTELSYYELLEVSPDAGNREIERAYQMAQATYGESSLATYSLYGDEELATIRARIEEAYRVLSEPAERSRYDRGLARAEALAEEEVDELGLDFPLDEFDDLDPRPLDAGSPDLRPFDPRAGAGDDFRPRSGIETESAASPSPRPSFRRPERLAPVQPDFSKVAPLEDDDGSPFTGARLRRARLARGIELEQVASVTKVMVRHLESIEADRYADLPAPVYARGFVSAYARCIGLDADRVCRDYMAALRDTENRDTGSRRRA